MVRPESNAETNAERGDAFESPRISYASIVWGQFRKNRVAVFGLWAIVLLVLLAIYTPFISLDRPFVLKSPDGLEFPLFKALFDRNLFKNAVDIFFNLLLVLSPLYVAIFLLVRRRWGVRFAEVRGRTVGGMLLAHFLLFLLFVPERFGPVDNPLHYSLPDRDYVGLVADLREQGKPVFAIFPLRAHNYTETDPMESVKPPSWKYWFGTDVEGRDLFSRMLYGIRISLTIGVVAVSIYVCIGVVLGALAGYFGGWVDILISRLIEIMICFPTFFLILTLAALIEERSIFHVMAIIGVTGWTRVARLIRAEFLKHKELEYTQAAIALGIPTHRVIFRHILPNAIAPVLVAATFGVASAILVESGLSFLGVGDVTVPSWGEILNTGRTEQKLWLILVPGFAIFFVVSVFNLVGEGLRDALDPKLRK